MPYGQGQRLPAEKASKLGHLDVLKSELVKKLCESFENPEEDEKGFGDRGEPIQLEYTAAPRKKVFAVDGSLQTIEDVSPPFKALSFVKSALLSLDQVALQSIDKDNPHPYALKDILSKSSCYHATVFPLRHVSIRGQMLYHSIRQIIFESLSDASLDGQLLQTLRWIAYEMWDDSQRKALPVFECPHCRKSVATLSYGEIEGECPGCGEHLYLTDMLGFHQEMGDEVAPTSVASNYMLISEHLLLFTGIRHYWENNRLALSDSLFIKDGPLSIRAQYSKLVNPIRRFIEYAKNQGVDVCVVGQEKSGAFYDYLMRVARHLPDNSVILPSSDFVKTEIQGRDTSGYPYGKDTNYGTKVFYKLDNFHYSVLTIPTGQFNEAPDFQDLVGGDAIFSTVKGLISSRYEGGLLPIELANGLASLSTYPSARILQIFSEEKMSK